MECLGGKEPGKKRFTSVNIAREREFEGLIAARIGINASSYPGLYESPRIPTVEAQGRLT